MGCCGRGYGLYQWGSGGCRILEWPREHRRGALNFLVGISGALAESAEDLFGDEGGTTVVASGDSAADGADIEFDAGVGFLETFHGGGGGDGCGL